MRSTEAPGEGDCHTGLAVCSHNDTMLTTVKAILGNAADGAIKSTHGETAFAGASLLKNADFAKAGDHETVAAE